MVARFPFSQSEARGLIKCGESNELPLSIEPSLETDAVAISPSISVASSLLETKPGIGRGTYRDGFEFMALSTFDVKITPGFAPMASE